MWHLIYNGFILSCDVIGRNNPKVIISATLVAIGTVLVKM